jgi:glycosyltransferase involved in cell wall biosynthesis
MPFSKKNILYVIPYFVPAWSYGGPVKVSYDFSEELIKRGNRVTVITTDVLDNNTRNRKLYEKINGIKIFRFKNISNFLAKKFNFYAPIGLRRWLTNNIHKFDIVHVHEIFTYQSIIASRSCQKKGIPYVIQPHGSLHPAAMRPRFLVLKHLIIKYFALLVRSSKAIIVLTEKEQKSVAALYPHVKQKIMIAPNGLDVDELKKVKPIDVHAKYKIPQKHKIIVFIGRIHYKKGLDIVLRSLNLLKNKLSFTFLIIGPDEGQKDNLQKLSRKLKLEKRIVFTGLMSGNTKLATLKGADLSILLSRSEGLPTTLLESAALGLPIVCSKESNFTEVENFGAGFIVKNIRQAAAAVKNILSDRQLQARMSNNALKLAAQFDIAKCTDTLIKIYGSDDA